MLTMILNLISSKSGKWQGIFSYVTSLFIGIIISTFIIIIAGYNPLDTFKYIGIGVFGSVYSIAETLVLATPLVLIAASTTLSFRGGFLNIGGEGQALMGAVLATFIGIPITFIPEYLKFWPFAIIVGFIGGGFWGAICGVLKAKYQINEILTTLMLNYVALWLSHYLVYFAWDDPSTLDPRTYYVSAYTSIPKILSGTRLHLGIIISLVLALMVWFTLNFTVFGYEIKAIGSGKRAALISGIDVNKKIMLLSFLSGGLAGVAGAMEVCGLYGYLRDDIISGKGFLGLGAALVGKLSPIGSIISGMFLAMLLTGSGYMQRSIGLPAPFVNTIIGILLLSILLEPFISKILLRLKNPAIPKEES